MDPTGASEREPGPAEDPVILALEETPSGLRQTLRENLRHYTTQVLGPVEHRSLAVAARHEGRLVGGLAGETHMGWFFLEILWVAPAFRGQGLGSRLLAAAEAEARHRGATNAYCNTFSFHAPDFYLARGYVPVGRLDDFPAGHYRLYLTKPL